MGKEELAIQGGTPASKRILSYGHQSIDSKDIRAVVDVLESDYLTCGPKVLELEESLAKCTLAKYAVAVSSGTAALHCACMAAGVRPGDEVITTPLTFAASANCILYCGGIPVFADVNEKTYNIDPECIERLITKKTKAVIAVDFTGQAVEIKRIKDICNKHNLVFIEDAAHAIGTYYNGNPVGSLADMTCFSFHPVKTITSGEGGAVTTNDKNFYEKLILAHAHGITHDERIMKNQHAEQWYYEQVGLGYNYRMTDFQSALLLSQLKKLDRFKARRREIVEKYNGEFESVPEIILQEEIKESDTCRHLYIIRLNLEKLTCERKQFYDALHGENIYCQVHYIPVYWFPYYQDMGYKKGLCPNAETLYSSMISIPLYPSMTDEDSFNVVRAVKKIASYYSKS